MYKIPLFLLLTLSFHCATNTLSREDITAMKARFMLDYRREPEHWPVMAGLKNDISRIFSVPAENAVGTNQIGFAITLLKFHDDNIEYKQLIKNHSGAASGGKYSFCPVFDKEWIAYGQSRGFNLFNTKTKQFISHIPYPQLEKRITDVNCLQSKPLTFLIQIESGNTPIDDRLFNIVEFNLNGDFEVLAELEQIGRHYGEKGEPWSFSGNTIVNYHRKDTRLEAFDFNLQPVQHPLCTLFNNRHEYDVSITRISTFITHPTLPFAILKEYREGQESRIWLARWDVSDKKDAFTLLLQQKMSSFPHTQKLLVTRFEFSPDGKWLVFRDHSVNRRNPVFTAMPVSAEEEYFLGKPVMLGSVMRKCATPRSTAWISSPLSYVVCDGTVLYKWELDKLERRF